MSLTFSGTAGKWYSQKGAQVLSQTLSMLLGNEEREKGGPGSEEKEGEQDLKWRFPTQCGVDVCSRLEGFHGEPKAVHWLLLPGTHPLARQPSLPMRSGAKPSETAAASMWQRCQSLLSREESINSPESGGTVQGVSCHDVYSPQELPERLPCCSPATGVHASSLSAGHMACETGTCALPWFCREGKWSRDRFSSSCMVWKQWSRSGERA